MCPQAIKALQEKFGETKAAFGPKHRFTFKTARKNPSAVSLNDAAEMAAQRRLHLSSRRSPGSSTRESSLSTTPYHLRTPDNEIASDQQQIPAAPLPKQTNWSSFQDEPDAERNYPESRSATTSENKEQRLDCTSRKGLISNETSKHVILPTSSSHAASPCSLTRIQKSVIDMSVPTSNGAPFAGLTITNIKSSLLLCGRVDGPTHTTNVLDSVMVVKCRQFRMHQCRNVDVYLTCSSRPIIEDCSSVRFAPLPQTYVGLYLSLLSYHRLLD